MVPFNTFSLPDLVAVFVTASLTIIFWVIFSYRRRLLDLLLANMLACGAVASTVMFLVDNVIPEGTPANAVAGADVRTLALYRWMWGSGWIGLACQIHFVIRYCHVRNWIGRRIGWVYVAFGVMSLTLWSSHFFQLREEPLAAVSSWLCAVPWQPVPGPLVAVFIACWAFVYGYGLYLLWRSDARPGDSPREMSVGIGLVRLAIVIAAVGSCIDMILAASGYAGISLVPPTLVLMAVAATSALVREGIHAEREKERIDKELELASKIQRQILPKVPPALPGFEIAGWSRSALQAGGDTYDFLALEDGRWMVTLADASGHGLGAALIIAETRAFLRAVAAHCSDPSEILQEVDRLLSAEIPESHFVTCFVGLLDPASNSISYASAGQGPIIFYEAADAEFHLEAATDLPLPLLSVGGANSSNDSRCRNFQPGDYLVLTTDGFWEDFNREGEQFGLDRLRQSLQNAMHRPVDDMIEAVREDLRQFLGHHHHHDDLTMVIVRKR